MEKLESKRRLIKTAKGELEADLVLRNARWLNVFTGEFLEGDIAISGGRIAAVGPGYRAANERDLGGRAVVPAFIDSHIHLESSVISPAEFARTVMPRGTAAVVTDPHEIMNVLGLDGLNYMMDATAALPLDVFFTLSSCVPCCRFDESGAAVAADVIRKQIHNPAVVGLAEMMDYVGTTEADEEILRKIDAAEYAGKVVDGHAPGLSGRSLQAYCAAGVSSDHECSTAAEGLEKLRAGQWVMVRDGTASKNLEALVPLFDDRYFRRCCLATDDKHPGELARAGHIDYIIRRAIELGARPANAYIMGSWNAAQRFGLAGRGAVAPGYLADLVVLDSVEQVKIESVYRQGRRVDDAFFAAVPPFTPLQNVRDTVHVKQLQPEDFAIYKPRERVIGLIDHELLTTDEGFAEGIDVAQDILKLCVIERHRYTGHIGRCYVKGYGLKAGAVATSIAHDSHNIIVIGTSDEEIAAAANCIREMRGGMCVVKGGEPVAELPLPIAGLMSELPAAETQARIDAVKQAASALGAHGGIDPIMTLSFLSLPVIPHLKLTTLGVVDVDAFRLAD